MEFNFENTETQRKKLGLLSSNTTAKGNVFGTATKKNAF